MAQDKLACGMYLPDDRNWGDEPPGWTRPGHMEPDNPLTACGMPHCKNTASEEIRQEYGDELLALEGRGRRGSTILWGYKCDEPTPKTIPSNHTGPAPPKECTYHGCLSLTEFATVLKNIHADGNQAELNEHFRPQDLVYAAGGRSKPPDQPSQHGPCVHT